MYQGTELVVQGVSYDLSRPEDKARMWGMIDSVAAFECTEKGHTVMGTGLFEYWPFGPHEPRPGLTNRSPARSGQAEPHQAGYRRASIRNSASVLFLPLEPKVIARHQVEPNEAEHARSGEGTMEQVLLAGPGW